MPFAAIDLTPRVGTEIRADRDELLSGIHAAKIRELLAMRSALVLRGVHFTDQEQLTFTRTLGQLSLQGLEKAEIYKITLDQAENEGADYLLGTFHWHFDGSPDDVPARASLLSARKLSPTGGQTEIANTYAAYEELPEEDKALIAPLKASHAQEAIQLRDFPEPSQAQLARWRRFPRKSHPLVWTHQSGRKSLVLGYTADYIEGLEPTESQALMNRLMAWATQPQFVYRHEWEVGDLLIWDNTGALHRAEPYAIDSGRMMHRTTLVGEEPVTA